MLSGFKRPGFATAPRGVFFVLIGILWWHPLEGVSTFEEALVELFAKVTPPTLRSELRGLFTKIFLG